MVRKAILFLFSTATVVVAVMCSSLPFEQQLPCRGQMMEHMKEETFHQDSGAIADIQQGFKSINSRLEAQELENERLKYEMKINDIQIKALNDVMFQRNLHLGEVPSYAFSAYLAETADVKMNEKIVFDREVFDDGSNYNQDTGVFAAPKGGVYVFSFFISTSESDQKVNVKLTVNNAIQSNAIVKTEHPGMQSQGGNVVILKLNRDDHVIIRAIDQGKIVSSESDRVSTFSGFLLY